MSPSVFPHHRRLSICTRSTSYSTIIRLCCAAATTHIYVAVVTGIVLHLCRILHTRITEIVQYHERVLYTDM